MRRSVRKILNETEHRPWPLLQRPWTYYQEWNQVIFLHWPVVYNQLRKFVPAELEIDLFDNHPWVSIVAFNMEKIRPKFLLPFKPISNFYEINIRTYVKVKNKSGVYFLSIEGGNKISCVLAKKLSGLPYRYSEISRLSKRICSYNEDFTDKLELDFDLGPKLAVKQKIDYWLTERYALFHDRFDSIDVFDIHHVEWPLYRINVNELSIDYGRFQQLLTNKPSRAHYSPGVQVIAWNHRKIME